MSFEHLFLYNEMPYDVICIYPFIYMYMRVTSLQFEESEVKSGFFLLWQMYLRRKTNGEETEIFYCQFLLIDTSIDMYGFISLYLI